MREGRRTWTRCPAVGASTASQRRRSLKLVADVSKHESEQPEESGRHFTACPWDLCVGAYTLLVTTAVAERCTSLTLSPLGLLCLQMELC